MSIVIIAIIAVICSAAGCYAGYSITSKIVRNKKAAILKEAESAGEMIKKEKILQAKEKFIQLKSEHDRAVNERNQKLSQSEQRAKQLENNLTQQQDELNKKIREQDSVRERLQAQIESVERKKEDLDRKIKEQNTRLEQISGLSSDEAKNILIENMKEEAKTEAMTYVNEVMEEAKMSANKEAKKIVVQTIQRVATEAAIENSVTVFNIESDEVKGRLIGREGRTSILRATRSRAASSAARAATSVRWKRLPASRSSSTTRRKRSSCRASIRYAVKSRVWRCTNW